MIGMLLVLAAFVILLGSLELVRRQLALLSSSEKEAEKLTTLMSKTLACTIEELDATRERLSIVESVLQHTPDLMERYARLCSPSRFEPTQ